MAGPILVAVTVHELAHGLMANLLGDPTARLAGRLTLNPLAHLDLFGTLAFLITQSIGWAKPVPVDARHFKHPRRDMIWVSLAGPAANLILAFICARALVGFSELVGPRPEATSLSILRILLILSTINVGLAVFNLIPIPPLDGSHVLEGLLPLEAAVTYHRLAPYGFLALMALIFLGLTDLIVRPAIGLILNLMLA